MQEYELAPVHTGQAIRMLKEAGAFMLLDHNERHYLVTEYFILQLKPRDAWLIQCGMAVEKRNCYYVKIKKEWQEANKAADAEAVVERYLSLQTQAEHNPMLYWTGVAIVQYRNMAMDGRLYAGMGNYTLLRADYLDMIPGTLKIVRVGDMAVVNGQHVLTTMPDDAWQENDFIRHYDGEVEA